MAPGLGVIDEWLPVCETLKTKDSKVHFAVVCPYPWVALRVRKGDPILKRLELLSPTYLAPIGHRGYVRFQRWPLYRAFAIAQLMSRRSRQYLGRASRAILGGPPTERIVSIGEGVSRPFTHRLVRNASLLTVSEGLLYDVYNEWTGDAICLKVINGHGSHVIRHSLHHGSIHEVDDELPGGQLANDIPRHIYLYHDRQQEWYYSKLGLQSMSQTGVPRHDPHYRQTPGSTGSNDPSPHRDHVALFSRGHGEWFLPRERKVSALKAILDVCGSWGKVLVVKPHPNERVSDLRQQLSMAADGLNGVQYKVATRSSIQELSNDAWAAITFYSGLPADLVQMNVPVINYLDLSGLSGPGTDGSIVRGTDPHSFSLVRKFGLALPADNQQTLEDCFHQIATDRNAVSNAQRRAYELHYFSPDGACDRIASVILAGSAPNNPE